MRLELTVEEVAALRDLLDAYLGDLSAEISHTDNPAFRRLLRDRRAHLARVREALTHPDQPPRDQVSA